MESFSLKVFSYKLVKKYTGQQSIQIIQCYAIWTTVSMLYGEADWALWCINQLHTKSELYLGIEFLKYIHVIIFALENSMWS